MKPSRIFLTLVTLAGSLPASATEINKANNTTALNSSGSWVSGGLPGTGDVAVWNSTVAAANTSVLGGSMTWSGIKVTNPGGNVTIGATSGATLSLGAGGIDVSSADRNLTINAALTPTMSQGWNVTSSNRSLTVAGQTGGSGVTITRTGDGTLNFNNTAANSDFAANLILSGGTTRFVNSSGIQAFSGSISGTGSLARTGNGTVVLAGNNAGFSGAFNITGAGPVHLGNTNALGGATVTFNSPTGANLDNASGAPLTLGGSASFVLANPLTFTGTHDLDLGATSISITGDRTLTVAASSLAIAGTVTASEGSLTKAGAGTLEFRTGSAVELSGKLAATGGTLIVSGGTVECGTGGTGNLEVGGGTTAELNGGSLVCRAVARSSGAADLVLNGGTLIPAADTNVLVSGLDHAWVAAGGAVIDVDGWWVTVPQPLLHDPALGAGPDGGLTVRDTLGGGKVTLTGICTHTGPTVVEAGTLVIGAGGSVSASPVIELRADAVLDAATGFTLASGQTLRGTGAVIGKLTVGAGATLSPGTDASPYASMEMAGAVLALQGTTELGIRKTLPEVDSLTQLDRVTYGGALEVTAESGTFFATGDRFVLFDALHYSGGFATIDLPTLPGGLFWETHGLGTDGSIEVIDTLPRPAFYPAAGRTFGGGTVSITGVAGSTIHYTTDGSDPLVSPTRVSSPSPATGIALPTAAGAFTIRAYQTLPGAPDGVVVNAAYTIVDTGVWAENGSGQWSDPAMWLDSLVAKGAGIAADFATVELGAGATVTLDQPQTIGRLLFGNEMASGSWTLTGSTLTLDNKTAKPEIQVTAGRTATITAPLAGTNGLLKSGAGSLVSQLAKPALSGAVLVRQGAVLVDRQNSLGSGPITLGDALTGDAEAAILQRGSDPWPPASDFGTTNDITVAAGPTGRLIIGRQSSGNYAANYTGTITLNNNVVFRNNGGDRLSIEGKITGTGNVTIEGNRVNWNSAANDFAGDLTVAAGGVFQPNAASAIPAACGVTINGSMGTNSTTGESLIIGSLSGNGTIYRLASSNPTLTIGGNGRNGNFQGVIQNDFPVVKTGSGTQIFSGTSTYTGGTTVNGGTLLVNNTTGSGTGTGTVTVNSGAKLGGSGTVGGAVDIKSGATLAPGAAADTIGTLTVGTLTLAGTYQCQVSGSSVDKIMANTSLDLSGSALAVSELAPTVAGSYVIAECANNITGTFGGTLPPGYSLSYADPKKVTLTVPASAGYSSWIGGFGLTGNDALPTADPDKDGVDNAVEFVLGGNPATVMDAALLPTVQVLANPGGTVPDGTYLKFTYRRTPASAYLNPAMQHDADLSGTWTNAVPGAAGVVEVVTPAGSPGAYTSPTPADKVEVFVPRTGNESAGKLFGRLRVVVP
ncbi:MAG: autotransporter-associated beta strand repeat-containing protein [Verrucomicrobia bacterium]|nr:autotransporter-associated beta strand repeat-containing protein [Verrucomicrobiota bacterium]